MYQLDCDLKNASNKLQHLLRFTRISLSEELLWFQIFLFLTLWNLVMKWALKQASTLRNSWIMQQLCQTF